MYVYAYVYLHMYMYVYWLSLLRINRPVFTHLRNRYVKKYPTALAISLTQWRHMALEILINTGSGNGLLPDGTNPLPEPMLTSHQ